MSQMSKSEPYILQVEVGLVENFCTIVCDPQAGVCAITDPAFEVDRLLRLLDDQGGQALRVAALLITHSHLDHIEGVPSLVKKLAARGHSLPIYVGDAEADVVAAACAAEGVSADLRPLLGGEALHLGSLSIEVLATPGHTRAGRSYYLPALSALLPGDTLFVGSCGRPASASQAPVLYDSLSRLVELPEETRIYPGHNYGGTSTSTIGWERTANPYLRCPDLPAFLQLCRRNHS